MDEIISTRRLVDISHSFDIFGEKEKAIAFCLARFDDDTKEAFLNLYTKVDADSAVSTDEGDVQPSSEANENVTTTDSKCPF